jgi:hypothetical protein
VNPEQFPSETRRVAEGIAALAISYAEQVASEEEWRAALLETLVQLGEANALMLRLAAAAVTSLPEPLDETPEEIESARHIREMMGVRSAEEDLAAVLRAREWLERLATELS